MKAKKALKKLKKKKNKFKSKVFKPHNSMIIDNHSAVKAEAKAIGEVVTAQILTELSAPLTPILSWFDGSGSVLAGKNLKRKTRVRFQSNTRNLAALPLKSPPCKSCPARSGGLCKCALKRFA